MYRKRDEKEEVIIQLHQTLVTMLDQRFLIVNFTIYNSYSTYRNTENILSAARVYCGSHIVVYCSSDIYFSVEDRINRSHTGEKVVCVQEFV